MKVQINYDNPFFDVMRAIIRKTKELEVDAIRDIVCTNLDGEDYTIEYIAIVSKSEDFDCEVLEVLDNEATPHE